MRGMGREEGMCGGEGGSEEEAEGRLVKRRR